MKPRTKLQFEVVRLHGELDDPRSMMLSWAKSACLDHTGYATKTRVVCMDCGNRFSTDRIVRKRAVCPHCNTKLKIEYARKTTLEQCVYVAIADIVGRFQVIRNFEIDSTHKAGTAVNYAIREILQHWIIPNGKHEVIARNISTNWYARSWNGNMEPRSNSWKKRYDIVPDKIHPESQFFYQYRMRGIDSNLVGISPLEAINTVPNSPKAETILKAKQFSLLSYLSNRPHKIDQHWVSIKIALRNQYKITDATLWIDYLDLLARLRKDLHNAYYVCPKNLKKEHDKMVIKTRSIQKREDERRKREKAIQDEAVLKATKGRFFDILISDGEIKIEPIRTVEDFIAEGDTLHHCIFTNNYHLRKESLILSARIKEKRIETVEVDLKTFDIIQSRGAFNKSTEYHDRIVDLVNRNINRIKQRAI